VQQARDKGKGNKSNGNSNDNHDNCNKDGNKSNGSSNDKHDKASKSSTPGIVVLAKHLCADATDWALREIEKCALNYLICILHLDYLPNQ
jgi:hypothetical protein